MEWPVSSGPPRGASCPHHSGSATDALELMRTAAAGKPPRRRGGAAAARGLAWRRGTEVFSGVRAGSGAGTRGRERRALRAAIGREAPEQGGGGGGARLVGFAGQSPEAWGRGRG